MADNAKGLPGFRWSRAANGGRDMPTPERVPVATAYSGTLTGGATIDINVGDPVRQLATGYWAHAAGYEASGTGQDIGGICVAIAPYWDGTVQTPGNRLPAATAYGTNEDRRSYIYIVPASAGLWAADANDKTTATTYAGYIALIGENVDHILTAGSEPKTNCLLHMTTHVATTAQWRIHGISQSLKNQDYSGLYVELIVAVNEGQQSIYTAAGL